MTFFIVLCQLEKTSTGHLVQSPVKDSLESRGFTFLLLVVWKVVEQIVTCETQLGHHGLGNKRAHLFFN